MLVGVISRENGLSDGFVDQSPAKMSYRNARSCNFPRKWAAGAFFYDFCGENGLCGYFAACFLQKYRINKLLFLIISPYLT